MFKVNSKDTRTTPFVCLLYSSTETSRVMWLCEPRNYVNLQKCSMEIMFSVFFVQCKASLQRLAVKFATRLSLHV